MGCGIRVAATTAVRLASMTVPLETLIRFCENVAYVTSCHVLIGFMCPYDIQFQPPVAGSFEGPYAHTELIAVLLCSAVNIRIQFWGKSLNNKKINL